MSGRSRSLPSWASAGGQELQPCEVKSSTAQGPDTAGGVADAVRPSTAVAAAPASSDRRFGVNRDMVARWALAPLAANQETVTRAWTRSE